MILRQTRLKVADNTGAKIVMCFGILGYPRQHASVGRVIKVTVKEVYRPSEGGPPLRVRPGQVCNALVIRCRQNLQRDDGRVIRFDDNAAILLTRDFKPIGSKVSGPVPLELKKGNWLKVLSLSSRII